MLATQAAGGAVGTKTVVPTVWECTSPNTAEAYAPRPVLSSIEERNPAYEDHLASANDFKFLRPPLGTNKKPNVQVTDIGHEQ